MEGKDEPRAECNYCGKDYACDTKNHGTSNKWSHLQQQCMKYPYRVDKRQKILSFEPKNEGGEYGLTIGKLKAVTLSVKEARKELAKMVIIDELPFRIVEGEGFKNH
ncbi:PREDICTED: uncharacterized protein LOC104599611 [Nelumbo nucifera]|uniref:Uncharacterized protein LOC104599611 n=1 Tax=Nelumbo nucifera TaxID=4432 RepID=A0A1U8AE59_NELNU|nr:PREDICTED: uncharacterized protein LOC104599611 [Nelumbo nucifera]